MKYDYTPVGSLILVKPLKFKYRTQVQTIPASPVENTEEEVSEVIEEKVKIKLNQQLAEVISIGTLDPEKTSFGVGDIIVYDINSVREFDLQKGVLIMAGHNVIAVASPL